VQSSDGRQEEDDPLFLNCDILAIPFGKPQGSHRVNPNQAACRTGGLNIFTSLAHEELDLFRLFDPFGHHPQVHVVRHGNNCRNDRGILVSVDRIINEGLSIFSVSMGKRFR